MLDSETKRRIDSCRNMLVGKVPNPQSQVEQITIALIYKFMDDMDTEAEELGGKRSFFTGEFAKYGWSNLMAPGMGGFDMLNLYSEAIGKMNENPGMPALFRDIFKNAYLPYRDPETLRGFLKEINGFTYDHAERLGDAFEYLLSVLGSQGDAGQFRTPRHIIDFMVEIIDPKKDESILDPACGTAGFLISSYKHILKHNSQDYQEQQDRETYDEQGIPLELLTLDSPLHYKGDLLTLDDKKRLATNIRGYDISPDMVRLSLVNMYLHGFASPHIDEYDTLTSDEKWNELADIILANPPFMSPKGGIKPHKRFSVAATRSEVLFVDYIAEHLTPNGRAAVIVPEGIIFQSGNAYKQLREMLVKSYLVAVISLPAGVFNPYSGVKTSVLVLDKRLAKKTDAILFAKISNDGYNLGAQRRPIDKNDLPAAVRNIKAWLESLRNGAAFDVECIANLSLVDKEKIGENGEWNLSGERYRSNDALQTTFDMVELGDASIFAIESGGTPKSTEEAYWKGGIHWATLVDLPQRDFISQITKTGRTISEAGLTNSSAKVLPVGTVIVSSRATIGRVGIARIPLATNQGFKNIVIKDATRAIPEFVAYMIKKLAPDMEAMATGGTFKEISKSTFATLKIPLPPLEVQKEIVAEIEVYQKIIDGARQVVENYQPRILINPGWPIVRLDEISEKVTDGDHQPPPKSATGVPFITISNIEPGAGIDFSKTYFVPREYYDGLKEYRRPKRGDVLYTVTGSFGIPVLICKKSQSCLQRG
ncbi:MAG: N-6 DNA methylase [Nitrosomonas sp.]|nr:N-6 DNA methylase [Nitrosomonas sp.]